MDSSRIIDFRVPRMATKFKYFFLIKRQNGDCNVRNFRQFLFGMILLTFLTFIALLILRKVSISRG